MGVAMNSDRVEEMGVILLERVMAVDLGAEVANDSDQVLYNQFSHADTTLFSRRNNICFFAL